MINQLGIKRKLRAVRSGRWQPAAFIVNLMWDSKLPFEPYAIVYEKGIMVTGTHLFS